MLGASTRTATSAALRQRREEALDSDEEPIVLPVHELDPGRSRAARA
jgi:hypothetical protein